MRQLYISVFIIALSIFAGCAHVSNGKDPIPLDGSYKNEDMAIEIRNNIFIGYDPATKIKIKCNFERKGDFIYIQPYIPEGQKMSRNVVTVWRVTKSGLESHHVEDMDTGEKFYENSRNVISLRKIE